MRRVFDFLPILIINVSAVERVSGPAQKALQN
jgi:hypothetical protein